MNTFMRSKRNSEIEQENTTFRVLSAMSCASVGWIEEREYYLKENNNAITTTSLFASDFAKLFVAGISEKNSLD